MKKTAAFFDFDGTLYNGVVAFDFLKFAILNKTFKLNEVGKIPYFLYYYSLEKLGIVDRYNINKRMYRKIKGINSRLLEGASKDFFSKNIKGKLMPSIVNLLNAHKNKNHHVVIATSALKQIIAPIKQILKADEIIATEVEIDNGIYTGKIKLLPIGENRAKIMREYCNSNNISINGSYAYSDHYSDIPMLNAVGNPVAVNPDARLRVYALRYGWKILRG